MAGFQLSDRAISCQRRGHTHEREIMVQSLRLDIAADTWMQEQGGEFRAKDKFTIELCVKKWLLPDAIAGDKQLLRPLVPDCESKHAAQVLRAIGPVTIVSVNDCFSIAIGVENVAELFQPFAQLAVVVNLAVENNPGSAVLIMDWLLSALQIDNREPPHAQGHRALEIETVVVGPPVPDSAAHPARQLLIHVT